MIYRVYRYKTADGPSAIVYGETKLDEPWLFIESGDIPSTVRLADGKIFALYHERGFDVYVPNEQRHIWSIIIHCEGQKIPLTQIAEHPELAEEVMKANWSRWNRPHDSILVKKTSSPEDIVSAKRTIRKRMEAFYMLDKLETFGLQATCLSSNIVRIEGYGSVRAQDFEGWMTRYSLNEALAITQARGII